MKKFINSFKYAFEGIVSSFKQERNMKIHFLAVILVVIFGLIYKISAQEWITLVILFGMVIASEMINTAIEEVVDIASPTKQKKAKLAKDIAAGAVLINAIIAVIVGLIIFIPKF